MKTLKKSQQKLIQFYSEFFTKIFQRKDYNLLIQKLDTDNDLMRSLSFDLIIRLKTQ